jgi:hypothetical protein
LTSVPGLDPGTEVSFTASIKAAPSSGVRDPGISAISGRALRFELGQKCFSGRNFSRRGAEIHTLAADFERDPQYL